jgi:dolichol kinase
MASDTLNPLSLRAEGVRKALHLVALVVPVLLVLLPPEASRLFFGASALLALSLDAGRAYNPTLARVIDRVFGFMMRASERDTSEGVVINGATWVLVTAALLAWWPNPVVAGWIFAAFMLADAAAALVGRSVGRTHWPRSARTIEGSLAFALAAGLVLGVGLGRSAEMAAVVGVMTLAEAMPLGLNDNVLVPIAGSAALLTLTSF